MDLLVGDVIIYIIQNFLNIQEIYDLFIISKRFLSFKNKQLVKNTITIKLLGQTGLKLLNNILKYNFYKQSYVILIK